MELSLMDILSAIRKKWVLVLVCTLLGIALLAAYTIVLVEPQYTATAKMYVYLDKGEGSSISSSDVSVTKSMVNTYLVFAKSDAVMDQVAETINLVNPDVTAKQLKKMFSGAAIDNTEAFTISFTSSDPELAQVAANLVADYLPVEIASLMQNNAQAEVIDYAKLPTESDWPLLRNIAIGALLGLVLSAGYAILVFMFDTTVYSRDDLTRNFTQPVLGAIPLMEGLDAVKKKKGFRLPWQPPKEEHRSVTEDRKRILNDNTPFAVSEAYRMARTNLLYLPIEHKCKKFAMTSCYQMEGKTTSTINLAIMLAQNNKRVILIDADLRKPRVAKNLGIRYENGLTEYLAGLTPTVAAIKTEHENLYVIPSGKESSLAAELLATGRMGTLLHQLEEKCDYIIIDTPPLNVVTDASVLVNLVDGYILSVRADRSNVNALKQVIASLEQVNATIYGFLLNSVNPKTGGAYGNYGKYGKYSNYERAYANDKTDENDDTIETEPEKTASAK